MSCLCILCLLYFHSSPDGYIDQGMNWRITTLAVIRLYSRVIVRKLPDRILLKLKNLKDATKLKVKTIKRNSNKVFQLKAITIHLEDLTLKKVHFVTTINFPTTIGCFLMNSFNRRLI